MALEKKHFIEFTHAFTTRISVVIASFIINGTADRLKESSPIVGVKKRKVRGERFADVRNSTENAGAEEVIELKPSGPKPW